MRGKGIERRAGPGVFALRFLSPMRPSAARAAHRRQAGSHICFGPVTPASCALAPWVHGWRLQKSSSATFDIVSYKQGVARARHRRDWPETDVGAGLPAMRRAGGARSHRRQTAQGMHLKPTPNQKFSRSTLRQIFFIGERRCSAQLRFCQHAFSASLHTRRTCRYSLPGSRVNLCGLKIRWVSASRMQHRTPQFAPQH
ncbi:hypothetical protein D3C79_592600 [compost metagenome]